MWTNKTALEEFSVLKLVLGWNQPRTHARAGIINVEARNKHTVKHCVCTGIYGNSYSGVCERLYR